ncbi:Cytochrome P450 71A1 [Linum grandiflorum]
MTYLMKNPTTMTKAQEEVRSAIGKKGFVNEQDIQQLSYLKAVVKETMRLQPVVPFLIPRESTESCNLGGYIIPSWAIGRDPEAWDKTHNSSNQKDS